MTWVTIRTTEDTTDDPPFTGEPSDPLDTTFWARAGARIGPFIIDNTVIVRVGWLNAANRFVPGGGTMTVTPIRLDRLNGEHRISVDRLGQVVDEAAWAPLKLPMETTGLWSVRLSDMLPPGGVLRARVFAWAHTEQ